jgi:hypothetical protein
VTGSMSAGKSADSPSGLKESRRRRQSPRASRLRDTAA